MKRLAPIAALALVACNPPVDETPGAFETFRGDLIANAVCRFGPVEDPKGQLLFATYPDNPDYLAVTRFKGETIKLVPREVPVFEGSDFDVTYDVIDYLKWQVRAVSEDGRGSLTLIRDGQVTNITADMMGSCG